MTIETLRKEMQGMIHLAEKLDDYTVKTNISPSIVIRILDKDDVRAYFSCSEERALLIFDYGRTEYMISINKGVEKANYHYHDYLDRRHTVKISIDEALKMFDDIKYEMFKELHK